MPELKTVDDYKKQFPWFFQRAEKMQERLDFYIRELRRTPRWDDLFAVAVRVIELYNKQRLPHYGYPCGVIHTQQGVLHIDPPNEQLGKDHKLAERVRELMSDGWVMHKPYNVDMPVWMKRTKLDGYKVNTFASVEELMK